MVSWFYSVPLANTGITSLNRIRTYTYGFLSTLERCAGVDNAAEWPRAGASGFDYRQKHVLFCHHIIPAPGKRELQSVTEVKPKLTSVSLFPYVFIT
jgi:hypothetical protein